MKDPPVPERECNRKKCLSHILPTPREDLHRRSQYLTVNDGFEIQTITM